MRVYKFEKDDGITLNEGNTSAFVTAQVQVRDIKKYFDGMSVADLIKATSTVQTVEQLLGQEQPDLALVVAILVSTGWNLNDDIFTPAEVWKARSSAVHKPMNDNHDAEKILGHIVQSRVLSKDGSEIQIEDNDSPPDEFDIEVAGVLYRMFPELSERIDEIIAKAKAGEMFVSMEAWFPDFAYGLINPDSGETKIIERNESTAFLTKHLRAYSGSGTYQGFRVGRVLKDIIFGAQGFVDTPANPESVIKVAATKVVASNVFVNSEMSELSEGGVENMDEKQLKELQAKLDEALAGLANKDTEISELQSAAKQLSDKNYDGQIVTLTEKIEALTGELSQASESMKLADTAKDETQNLLDEAIARAEKGEAELEGIRKTETARERFAKLSEVKAIDDAEATLAELTEMTDETFEVVLKYAGEAKAEVVKEEKPKDNSVAIEEKEAEKAEATLDSVKEEDSADFNANEDAVKSESVLWASTAAALLRQREEEKE